MSDELVFESEEFDKALGELLEAEPCEPCGGDDCEYAPLCRYLRGEDGT